MQNSGFFLPMPETSCTRAIDVCSWPKLFVSTCHCGRVILFFASRVTEHQSISDTTQLKVNGWRSHAAMQRTGTNWERKGRMQTVMQNKGKWHECINTPIVDKEDITYGKEMQQNEDMELKSILWDLALDFGCVHCASWSRVARAQRCSTTQMCGWKLGS